MYHYRRFTTIFLSLAIGWQLQAASPLGRFVVVGDSLTAGFQNFSLFTSRTVPGVPPGGQDYGYAQLIAKQAGTDLINPTVLYPGIPPTLQIDSAGRITRAAGLGIRISPFQTLNLSVPSFTVADAVARDINLLQIVSNPQDALAVTVLGFGPCGVLGFSFPVLKMSSVTCGVQLEPDTLLVSLGSNDALQALTFGIAPTTPGDFRDAYHEAITKLKQTHARLMLANIADVTTVPYLWSRDAFLAQCGTVPARSNPSDYFVVDLADPTKISGDICSNYVIRSNSLVARAKAAVTNYNRIIEREAEAAGAALLDINALLADVAARGRVVAGKRLTTAFLGGLFSLDGLHPSNTGYAIIANEAIATMNREWGTHIVPVSLERTAQNDPLVPKN